MEVALSATPDVVAWTYYPAGLDEQAARERIGRQRQRAAQGIARRYVLWDAAGTELGTCGIGALDAAEPEVFYALLPAARGRGAATSAVLALVEWARSVGCATVALKTIEGNAASERVARRAGFTCSGGSVEEQHGRPVRLLRWTRVT
ncbi:Protein N-acetyltransferase, RimJ/RimL family [Quadrisphaera granulorum]|uniref:RimJ/RimL family protein N-acetyltransferase n=1 Tax=Quadrisphaera granulorum TaxID=317664 RepID=A0A316A8M1_9ACTN|nr:RimJ/RimL family protein N-acetyltransferase [Quadrisphaera granulorum]SZE96234.1 Protein N-acetyltransferase, RimJ/RimL family [Quadrisphaera granulorum]